LSPDDYAPERLEALDKQIRESSTADRLADFDLLATVALFRYASDLATGRVHPDEVKSDWKALTPELDITKPLDEALTKNDLAPFLESLAPQHPGYAHLREALVKLREQEAVGGWASIPSGPKMKKGSTDPRLPQLRERLRLEPAGAFDVTLDKAVRHAQATYGIDPDGVVSDATLAELNTSVADRIRQVELNLERWRWIPRSLGDTYVLVNIPGFDLELTRNGAPAWHTRVVTGKELTPTPLFSDRIVSIVIHPPWNVPESIAVNEYLPELRKNRKALERHGLKVLEGTGDKAQEIDPKDVNWDRVSDDKFPYHLRQDPGAENPLGQVKFALTNDFSIYLHDTPGGHAFNKTERDLSHGCIRVENALELANQITNDSEKAAIREALANPEEKHIALAEKIPVHIFYWTAWADEAGELHFGPDVYGFDAPQREAIAKAAEKNAATGMTARR
jgi:murein L,D-transpeptidase YcbB/YkuD